MPAPTYDAIPTFPAMLTFTPTEHAVHAAFLHQNTSVMITMASHMNPVHVTMLLVLSASLPTFNRSGTPTMVAATFKHWIEELESIQRLTRREDPTLLAIVQGKLPRVTADRHASTRGSTSDLYLQLSKQPSLNGTLFHLSWEMSGSTQLKLNSTSNLHHCV
ncbi:hypothetical protein HPB50_007688 [Hyalomma asiaticum]|uniref:Uncharacterized protein n=1 Tax=Hyalomma asiaticum TaxID=266040 RepID=A0ACB7SWM7_HYAAI|nr:hypothetical protein HPB50_007688 [Hyalomma asiaticum]